MGPIQMHREANLTLLQKGQMSMYDRFSNFGRPLSLMICAKIQNKSILSSGEEDFYRTWT